MIIADATIDDLSRDRWHGDALTQVGWALTGAPLVRAVARYPG